MLAVLKEWVGAKVSFKKRWGGLIDDDVRVSELCVVGGEGVKCKSNLFVLT